MNNNTAQQTSVLEDFKVNPLTLLADRCAAWTIRGIGIGVILLSVLLILVFITMQIIPLFQKAEMTKRETISLTGQKIEVLAMDEWSELPAAVNKEGITFIDRKKENKLESIPFEKEVSAFDYKQKSQSIAAAHTDGSFSIIEINYQPQFQNIPGLEETKRTIRHDIQTLGPFDMAPADAKVSAISYGKSEESSLVATLYNQNNKTHLKVVTLTQSVDLFGNAGDLEVGESFDLTDKLTAKPTILRVSNEADLIVIAQENGDVAVFRFEDDDFSLVQSFKPFEGHGDLNIKSMDFVLGDVSLIFSNREGRMLGYSLFKPGKGQAIQFGLTKKDFPNMAGPAEFYTKSMRNKSFITGSNKKMSLRYFTTENTNWESVIDYDPQAAVISGKYDSILVADTSNKIHIYDLNDPHPESSFRTFFGDIYGQSLWYEGSAEPEAVWQSSGASDEFEKKMSMWPLIFGTLKATFYTMLFAVPIALMAAIYTSQFLVPELKAIVKPIMEIMASLPSVVIGYLGAVWLAPRIEYRFPSILLIILFVPLAAMIFGYLWNQVSNANRATFIGKLPVSRKVKARGSFNGIEFVIFLPFLLAAIYIGWTLGPSMERVFFANDFTQWWVDAVGLKYEQKNALIVGFSMGFAVIPIIFTIAEDALSNVPKSLTSASLALGASRWQTSMRVVVPTASPGIFSGIMIGLGRAVGETMIVLFASGGTALMDMNLFNGMRTLSINLATELPEAAEGGTLFRALFLGAFLLFALTFCINTVAEALRLHLRNKYKTA